MYGYDVEKKITIIFLYLLIGACILLPADFCNIKKGLLIVVILINLKDILRLLVINRRYQIVFSISVAFFFFLCLLSYIANGDLLNAIKGGYSCLYFLILYPILYYKIDILKIFIRVLKCLAILTVVCVLLDAANLMSIYQNPILDFFYTTKNLAVITKGSIYYSYYKLYFKAAVLLTVLASYSLHKKQYVWCIISGLAMFFTGSDMLTLAYLYIVMIMFISSFCKIDLKKIAIEGTIFACLFLMFAVYLFPALDPLGVRQSIIKDIGLILLDKPSSLFLGSGYGTPIYITVRGDYEMALEWSFLDFFRMYGILGLIAILIIISWPIYKLYKAEENTWMILAATGFIIVATTNPLLNNSTGFSMLVLMYALVLKNEDIYERKKFRKVC